MASVGIWISTLYLASIAAGDGGLAGMFVLLGIWHWASEPLRDPNWVESRYRRRMRQQRASGP
jgi:hypothetical protein